MPKVDMNELGKVFIKHKLNCDKKLVNNDLQELRILFNERCQKNKKYTNLKRIYDELRDLIYGNHNYKKQFVNKTVNRGLYAEDDYYKTEFNEKLYLKAKNWAENWDTVKATEEQKINKLKNGFTLFKKARVKKAEDNLEYMQYQVDKYNKCLSCEKRKEEILKTYGSEKSLNKALKSARNDMAKEVVEENIMNFPNAIGLKHDTHGFNSVLNEYNFQDEVEEVCNNIRKEVKDYLIEFSNKNMEKTKDNELEL